MGNPANDETEPENSVGSAPDGTTGSESSAAAQQATAHAHADRKFIIVSGTIFLVFMTGRYLYMVLDHPEPLPWQRGRAFQAFRVDVNNATWIEWSQLDGIGPSLAHRIVADRKLNGPFTSIDDIQRVEGIGPVIVKNIRAWLTITSATAAESRDDVSKEVSQ